MVYFQPLVYSICFLTFLHFLPIFDINKNSIHWLSIVYIFKIVCVVVKWTLFWTPLCIGGRDQCPDSYREEIRPKRAKGKWRQAKGDCFLSRQGHFREMLVFAFFGYLQKSNIWFWGVNKFKIANVIAKWTLVNEWQWQDVAELYNS